MGGVVTDTNCQRASQSLYEIIAVSFRSSPASRATRGFAARGVTRARLLFPCGFSSKRETLTRARLLFPCGFSSERETARSLFLTKLQKSYPILRYKIQSGCLLLFPSLLFFFCLRAFVFWWRLGAVLFPAFFFHFTSFAVTEGTVKIPPSRIGWNHNFWWRRYQDVNKSRSVMLTRSTGQESVTQQTNKRLQIQTNVLTYSSELSPRLYVEFLSHNIGLLGDASTARKLILNSNFKPASHFKATVPFFRSTQHLHTKGTLCRITWSFLRIVLVSILFRFVRSFVSCGNWFLHVVNENQQTFHTALSVYIVLTL